MSEKTPKLAVINEPCSWGVCIQLRAAGSTYCTWHAKKMDPPVPGRKGTVFDSGVAELARD
jgi:hypothetical protein